MLQSCTACLKCLARWVKRNCLNLDFELHALISTSLIQKRTVGGEAGGGKERVFKKYNKARVLMGKRSYEQQQGDYEHQEEMV